MSNVTNLTEGEYQFLMTAVNEEIVLLKKFIAEYQKENEDQKAEIEILKNALHRDKTGLCKAIDDIRKIAEGYSWIAEGRGPYAYNDDNYFKEAGYMLDAIKDRVSKAMTESGWSHAYCCTKLPTYEELINLLEKSVKEYALSRYSRETPMEKELYIEYVWQQYKSENRI